jgi:GMP synthase-like glutamine amidotransferase
MHILVLQHASVEHPGIFRDFFREDGFTWDTAELDAGEPIPALEPYDFMLVMGGPQDVWQEAEHPWLVTEKAAIKRLVLDMRRPFLGICLGHQLLAAALGGRVAPAEASEVGVLTVDKTAEGSRDPLLRGIGDPMKVLQWHGAEVVALPDRTTLLASSAACPIQAFRFEDHAYGLQFHVEITSATVAEWAEIPAYACSLSDAMGPGAVERLKTEVGSLLPASNRDARVLYDNLKSVIAASCGACN